MWDCEMNCAGYALGIREWIAVWDEKIEAIRDKVLSTGRIRQIRIQEELQDGEDLILLRCRNIKSVRGWDFHFVRYNPKTNVASHKQGMNEVKPFPLEKMFAKCWVSPNGSRYTGKIILFAIPREYHVKEYLKYNEIGP